MRGSPKDAVSRKKSVGANILGRAARRGSNGGRGGWFDADVRRGV
jgi:hypothetical protein